MFPNFRTLLILCAFTSGTSHAVTVRSNAIDNKSIYSIEFADDSRNYLGKESTITSISLQEYITASFRVVELNIVTDSDALLRIYHSRQLKPGEAQQALADGVQAGTGASPNNIRRPLPTSVQALTEKAAGVTEAVTSSTVIKEYPLATHARTVEYRLQTRSELLELYDELKKHWLKEPAYYINGQIVPKEDAGDKEAEPRSLGGTIFRVDE